MTDYTIVRDDELSGRWRHCLFCGRDADEEGVLEVRGFVWCIVLCRNCMRTRGWSAVDELLMRRTQTTNNE